MDAATGDVLWEFQTGSGIAAAPVTYEVDGEQYVAVFAAGSTNPYGGSVTQGDSLWAFKLGGTYTTESGSQEGPDTAPLSIRRPVGGAAVEGDDGRQHRAPRPGEPHRRHGSRTRQRVAERRCSRRTCGCRSARR